MTDTPTTPPITWRITGQLETQQAGASGTYTPGVQVSFLLSNGDIGTVFVPRSQYTPDNVRNAVHAWAMNMAEISGLSTT